MGKHVLRRFEMLYYKHPKISKKSGDFDKCLDRSSILCVPIVIKNWLITLARGSVLSSEARHFSPSKTFRTQIWSSKVALSKMELMQHRQFLSFGAELTRLPL